jgi:hypothetical protein
MAQIQGEQSIYHIILTILQWQMGYAFTMFIIVAVLVGFLRTFTFSKIDEVEFETTKSSKGGPGEFCAWVRRNNEGGRLTSTPNDQRPSHSTFTKPLPSSP